MQPCEKGHEQKALNQAKQYSLHRDLHAACPHPFLFFCLFLFIAGEEGLLLSEGL